MRCAWQKAANAMQHLSKDPMATWASTEHKIHRVTNRIFLSDGVGKHYTDCGLRMALLPGRWVKEAANCFACRAVDILAGRADASPQRIAETAIPYWLFRTTGGILHGVSTTQLMVEPRTFCGISVLAKLAKETGRWEYEPLELNCIGCVAMYR